MHCRRNVGGLEWLPAKGYVLLFTDAELILPDDEEEFATFLEVLNDAGEAWASGQAASSEPDPFIVSWLYPSATNPNARTGGCRMRPRRLSEPARSKRSP